jgi:branched-chain amino acid transport system permease protein
VSERSERMVAVGAPASRTPMGPGGASPLSKAGSVRVRSRLPVVPFGFLVAAAAMPFYLSRFNVERVAAEALVLSIVGLSFVLLSSVVGMVSLSQTAIAAVAGYTVAYGTAIRHWPVVAAVVIAIVMAVAVGLVFGLVATRTSGIYFLVITLAMGLVVNKFALQNRSITNGSTGINRVHGPKLLGLNLDNGIHRFYALLVVAVLIYVGLRAVSSSHFGATLHAVRDNPTRMRSLGYSVQSHRVVAFMIAALVAAIGGIFGAWYRGRIDPTSASLGQAIDLLIVCVLGGMTRLEGAFIGAGVFVSLRTYAADFTGRFNTLIGVALLIIALVAPDGLRGIAHRVATALRGGRTRPAPATDDLVSNQIPATIQQGEYT